MIYVDVLWLTQFTMILLALYLTSSVLGARPSFVLSLGAAAIGAAAGSFALLSTGPVGLKWVAGIVGFGLSVVLPLRPRRPGAVLKVGFLLLFFSVILGALCFYLLRAAIGVWGEGAASPDARSFVFLGISLGTACLMRVSVCRAKRIAERTDAEVVATVGGATMRFAAQVDSGHTLTEPFSGLPIVFVPRRLGRTVIPRMEDLTAATEPEALTASATDTIRFVPYKTESGSGILVCLPADELHVNGIPCRGYLAVRNDEREERGLCPLSLVS